MLLCKALFDLSTSLTLTLHRLPSCRPQASLAQASLAQASWLPAQATLSEQGRNVSCNWFIYHVEFEQSPNAVSFDPFDHYCAGRPHADSMRGRSQAH